MKIKKVLFSLFMIFLSTLVVYADAPQSITINGTTGVIQQLTASNYLPNYNDEGLNVTVKTTTDGKITYCINPDEDLYTGVMTYNKGDKITDSSILGVLVYGYTNYGNGVNTGNTDKDYFITNLALWKIIGSRYKLQGVNCSNNTYNGTSSSTVASACALATRTYTPTTSSISVNNSNISMTLSGNYYVTGAIGVNLSANATDYTVTLGSGAPTGAEVIDKSGTSFKIRVPKSSVTSTTSFGVTITATYTNYAAYEYDPTAGNSYQSVALLVKETEIKSTNLTLNITVTPPSTTTIKVYKYIYGTTSPLGGASFIRFNPNNGSVIAGTGWNSTTENPHTISNLVDGTYGIKETTVPDNYQTSATNTVFKITNGSVEIISGNASANGTAIFIYNNHTPQETKFSVKIIKQNYLNQTLSSAFFVLKNSQNQEVDNWISTTTAHTTPLLSPGVYTIHEVQAPPGYVAAADITFRLENDGTVVNISNSQVFSNGTITIVNYPETVTPPYITLIKTTASGQTLKGAVFKLRKTGESFDQTIDLRTTAASTFIVESGAGTYTLTETTVPDGYTTSGSIIFSVDSSGIMTLISGTGVTFSTDRNTMIIANNQITTQITIVKRDGVNTVKELTGAVFTLQKSDGTINKTLTFGSSTSVTETLTPGTYTLTETTAPTGYVKLASSVTFIVGINGKVTSIGNGGAILGDKKIAVNNNQITTQITIVKRDGTNTSKELSGAKFTLQKSDGTFNKTLTFGTSTSVIENLTPGTYILTETIAPTGYVKLTDTVTFNIGNDGKIISIGTGGVKLGDKKIAINNNPVTTQITIVKRDGVNTSTELKGAVFTLKNSDGTINKTLTFGTSTSVTETLTPGEYTLTETKAPDGYVKLTSPITFNVGTDGKVISVGTGGAKLGDKKIAVNNNQITTQIIIVKRDGGDTSTELKGAVFNLKKKDGSINKTLTFGTSTSVTETITPGEYTLTETTAPTGYVKLTDAITFKVGTDGKIISVGTGGAKLGDKKIAVDNSKVLGEITIVKRDALTITKLLSGAEFKLRKSGETEDRILSFNNATEITIPLPPGTYTLTESKAPDGYAKLTNAITFIIDNSGKVSKVTGTGGTKISDQKIAVANNEVTTQITIVKRDGIDQNTELKGAVFTLKKSDGSVNKTLTFGTSTSVTETLTPGTYTLTETKAPDGYVKLTSPITFKVGNDGKIIEVGTGGAKLGDQKIAVNNNKITGKVTIIKKDSRTNTDLTGAVFKLQKTNAPTSEETITFTTASVIKNLIPGEYTLTEIEAPDGYELDSTPFKFKITATGIVTNDKGTRITGGKIIIHNEKEPNTGEAYISKRDITTGEELPGAHLKVVDSSGKLIEEWTSTDTPKILYDLLPGTYTLSETIAPEGYQKSTETIRFTIDEDGKVVGGTIVMYNEPKPVVGKAVISKRDANTGKELAGAVLVLKDEEGNVIERWTTTTKPYTIDNLAPGTYTVSEEEAPKKYILTKNDITFTVDENGYVAETIILNNYPNEVTTNVQTGDKKFIIAVIIGLLSLGYTIFAYMKYHKINAKV